MTETIVPGSYLIASPTLLDPNFRRTVVMICEHGPHGSVGLVVNRPTQYTLPTVVPNLDLPGVPTVDSESEFDGEIVEGTIFSGGPVESNRLMIVRRGAADLDVATDEGASLLELDLPSSSGGGWGGDPADSASDSDESPDLQQVWEGIYLVADISATLERFESKREVDLTPYRFYLGYAGWGSEQLEAELKEGAWIVHPPTERFVFDDRPTDSWKAAIRDRGGIYRMLAEMPHDPTQN